MSIKIYSRIKLLVDNYAGEGVQAGALGYVIEMYSRGKCEVEFYGEGGITIAQLVLDESEIVECEPDA